MATRLSEAELVSVRTSHVNREGTNTAAKKVLKALKVCQISDGRIVSFAICQIAASSTLPWGNCARLELLTHWFPQLSVHQIEAAPQTPTLQ